MKTTVLDYIYAYPWWAVLIAVLAAATLASCLVMWAASQTLHEEEREGKR